MSLTFEDPFETGIIPSETERMVLDAEVLPLFKDSPTFNSKDARDAYNNELYDLVVRGLDAQEALARVRQFEPAVTSSVDQLEFEAQVGRKARFSIVMANLGIIRRIQFGSVWGTPDYRSYRFDKELEVIPALTHGDLFHESILAFYNKLEYWDRDQKTLYGYMKGVISGTIRRQLSTGAAFRPSVKQIEEVRALEAPHISIYDSDSEEERDKSAACEYSDLVSTIPLTYKPDRDEDADERIWPDEAPLVPDIESSSAIDEGAAIETTIERCSALKDLIKVKRILSGREWKIITLRYGLDSGYGRSFEEIAQMYSLTRERIRQIEAKAFEKARMAIDDYRSYAHSPNTGAVKNGDVEVKDSRQTQSRAVSLYIQSLKKYLEDPKNGYKRTYKDFYKTVGIKHQSLYSVIHGNSDLIQYEGHKRSFARMKVAGGSVTVIGLEKIEDCFGSKLRLGPQIIGKLEQYLQS